MNLFTIFSICFLFSGYVNSEPTTKTMIVPSILSTTSTTSTTSTITTITSTTTTSSNTTNQKIHNYVSPIILWVFVGIILLIIIISIEYVILSNNIYNWGVHPITVLILLIIASPFIFILQVLYVLIIKPIKWFSKNKINNQVQIHIEIHENTIEEPHQDNLDNLENLENLDNVDNVDNISLHSIIYVYDV